MIATKLLPILLLATFLYSCTTDRMLLKTYRKSDCYNGIAPGITLDGSYSNKDSTLYDYQRFSNALFPCRSYKKHCINGELITQIDLKYDGASHLKSTLFYLDGHQEQRTSKVKNKGSYLSLKRTFFLIPIPLLFFIEEDHKTILLKDTSGRLIAVNRHQDWGMAFLFIGGAHDDRTARVVPPLPNPALSK